MLRKVGDKSHDSAWKSPKLPTFKAMSAVSSSPTHHELQITMTAPAIVSRISRTGKSATSLALSLRSLTIFPAASRSTPQTRTVFRRNVSTATRPWHNVPISRTARPSVATCVRAIQQQQQTRGMKVHSSIKKRCEHCKVGGIRLFSSRIVSQPFGLAAWADGALCIQWCLGSFEMGIANKSHQ